jgi:flagellar motor switch protein FliM
MQPTSDPIHAGPPTQTVPDDGPVPLRARLIATTALSEPQRLSLHSLCLLFTRAVNANMTRWLGVPFTASLAGVERAPFYEIIHSPEAETHHITPLTVGPASQPALLQMDLPLVYLFVELLLGGPGGTSLEREPTEIEGSIVHSVVDLICRDFSTALSSPELEIRNDPSLPSRSIDRLMPTIDSTLSLSFDLTCGAQRGRIAFTLSSETAKLLIRSLDGPPKTPRQTSPEMRNGLLLRLRRTMHMATLQLPNVRIPLSVVRRLSPGDLLTFDLFEDTPATFSIAGRPAFYASPVDAQSRRGAYIAAPME